MRTQPEHSLVSVVLGMRGMELHANWQVCKVCVFICTFAGTYIKQEYTCIHSDIKPGPGVGIISGGVIIGVIILSLLVVIGIVIAIYLRYYSIEKSSDIEESDL